MTLKQFIASLKRPPSELILDFDATDTWQTGGWDRSRRVIIKIEHTEKGSNPRYVVTNLAGKPQFLYEKLYCARGEMENRIKEQQFDLFADRTRCHQWWPNQFRLLLSSLAYILLETIRRIALTGTEQAHVYVATIRLKLLKIGAVILRNTRAPAFYSQAAVPTRSSSSSLQQNLPADSTLPQSKFVNTACANHVRSGYAHYTRKFSSND